MLCNVVDRCGGCPWLSSSANAEQEHKLTRLRNTVAALDASHTVLQFRTAPSRIEYRNRIRLRIDEHGAICFFNTSKSPECAVLEPRLRQFVGRLREWSQLHTNDLAPFAHLEARSPDIDGNSGLFLTHRPQAAPAQSVAQRIATELGAVLAATDRDSEVPLQRLPHFQGTWLYAPLDGFVQVNPAVNQWLVEEVVAGARTSGCHTFADLFGGAGNFALPLAHAGLSGLLVEAHPNSVRAAQLCAQQLNRTGLECLPGDAIATARQSVILKGGFELVVVDPPRAGIRDGLDTVSSLATRAIAYCSCNLDTLERDLRMLLTLGWSLQRLTGFDMFPGTEHVEALAWLVPAKPGSS
jgi:23S rRNA (uracil1939-C5)-methyltransferase